MKKSLSVKKHIRVLFLIAILLFIFNKLYLRPWVLENESTAFFRILVLSVPNLIEAFVGTLLLTGILLQMRLYFTDQLGSIKDNYVYILAFGLAGVYSISQEFKWHNIGGNNVFDSYDVIASILGLMIAYGLIRKYGFADTTELKDE
jgi:hypothetical protein